MAGFSEIIGQEHIKEHLQEAILSGMMSHAYILCGDEGSGKKTVADAIAMTLFCERGEAEPCRICHSCKQFASHNHPDIKYLIPEKPDVIKVDEIRKQIINDVGIKPYSSDHKVYIIPNAERMNPAAQNALLKTLEEPPAYAIIFLLCSNELMLLETIRSRCVMLNLRPLKDSQVQEYLMEKMQIPDYQARICSAFARGCIGRALALLNDDEFAELNREAVNILKNVKRMDVGEIRNAVIRISELKLGIPEFLDYLFLWYKDVALCKATGSTKGLLYAEEEITIAQAASDSSYEDIQKIIALIEKTKRREKANVNMDVSLELLFLAMKEN